MRVGGAASRYLRCAEFGISELSTLWHRLRRQPTFISPFDADYARRIAAKPVANVTDWGGGAGAGRHGAPRVRRTPGSMSLTPFLEPPPPLPCYCHVATMLLVYNPTL